eukprot:1898984-Pyramimonas_sp.AAC.1
MLANFQDASSTNLDIMKIIISRSRPTGGLRAAMSDQLVAKSGDVRIAQMMTKMSGKLKNDARSAT